MEKTETNNLSNEELVDTFEEMCTERTKRYKGTGDTKTIGDNVEELKEELISRLNNLKN